MRSLSSLLVLVLGLLALAVGIGQLTLWASDEMTQARTQQVDEAPLTVISDGVIGAETGREELTIEAEGEYTVALARLVDVEAWVGDAAHVRITGVEEGAGDEVPLVVSEHVEGDSQVPDPTDSDMWVDTQSVDGPLDYRWVVPDESGEWALLVFRDGADPAPAGVMVEIEPPTSTLGLVLVGTGALLILLALLLFARALGRRSRQREEVHPEGSDDAEDAVSAEKAEGPEDSEHQAEDDDSPARFSTAGRHSMALGIVAVLAVSPVAGVGAGATAGDEASAETATDHSVLMQTQLQRIMEHTAEVVVHGDQEGDLDLLEARVAGNALEVRELIYRHREITESIVAEPLGTETLAAAVTSDVTFPRHAVLITQHEDAEIPQVLVLAQEDPRENYKLTQAMTMMPGTEFPAISAEDGGVMPVGLEEDGAHSAPKDAMLRTADFLDDKDHDFGTKMQQSPYIEDLHDYQEQIREAAAEVDVTYTRTLIEQDPTALRLPDGSVLAVGSFESTMQLRPQDDGDAIVFDDPTLAELADTASTTSEADVVNRESVILHVPADDADPMVLLGVHDILDQVTILD